MVMAMVEEVEVVVVDVEGGFMYKCMYVDVDVWMCAVRKGRSGLWQRGLGKEKGAGGSYKRPAWLGINSGVFFSRCA